MKPVLGAIVIAAFLGMAGFGIFAMNHGNDHRPGCLGAAAQGVADCPSAMGNLFASLSFHFDAFKFFSTATLAAALAFLLALAPAILFGRRSIPPLARAQTFSGKREPENSFSKRQLTRWIALHEKRDPAQPFLF